ncbi:DUF6443 domain-containing protein [Chryseobacterium sp.]|uniref:DUF6443 domain-containing protein n=1 Tax=Chryseobacterium sp. TaxID=1871047 RepID=UPI0025C06873|nr:DUF6443 domain-containing protein [Chryseobacterium sp.]
MKKIIQLNMLLLGIVAYSQITLNTTITQPDKVISDPVSINLLSGFNANSLNINSFHAYISSGTGGGTANPSGLSSNENYIYSKSCLNDDCSKTSESVQYFDSWGRAVQSIAIKATPSGKDIVSHFEYDQFGRQVKGYLPVPQSGSQSGAIYTSPLSNASAVYGSEKIYSESILENSPLGRIQQQIQVGNDWAAKPVVLGYDANIDGEVIRYAVTTTWLEGRTKYQLTKVGNYGANTLAKNSITDEDGNISTEFKNKKGQTVLTRKKDGNLNSDTYYVYNEYNQLAYVITPLAVQSGLTDQTTLDNLCYQYHYDGWKRLVEKKVPGKGWEYMVYNKANKLVMSQDANQRSQGQWSLVKYDQFGRVVYTGITNNSTGRNTVQNNINANANMYETRSATSSFTLNGMPVYYSKTAGPTNVTQVTSVNYYDTYPSGTPTVPSQILGQNILSQNAQSSDISTKSLPVASYVKNIEDDNWTKNYIWYDTKGRMAGTHTINHLGGYTKTESELDFAGMTKQTKVYHKRMEVDAEKVIVQTYTYDNQNRLLVHKHKIDNNPEEILSQNVYNELSQVKTKKVGGTDVSQPLQTVSYSYNIRGWRTKINDPSNLNGQLFGYEIKYTNPVYANISGVRYNGNITEVDWKNASEDVLKRYVYSYDNLNRLKDAVYTEPNSTTPFNNNFNENVTYDLNGNIKSLKRNAFPVTGNTSTMVDDLVYQYTGNRLDKVIENSLNDTGYEGGNNTIDYDLNGNMLNMKDKGISSIGYNYLNLPNVTVMSEGNPLGIITNYTTNNLYRADGTKLRKTVYKTGGKGVSPITTYTDYLDGFQYTYEQGELTICADCISLANTALEREAYTEASRPVIPTWTLDFVPTSEGFYNFRENRYIYQYKDHLGNARISFAKSSAGVLEVTDTNNYYPFGLNHIGGTNNGLLGGYYNYKYNGKEIQESGMYDFGARMYMPDLGRWGVVDALSEQMRRYSPYNYAFNNPVGFIDPDGNAPYDPRAFYGEHSAFNTDFDPNSSLSSYSGMGGSHANYFYNDLSGGGGGAGTGGYTFSGNAASSIFNYFVNGGDINGITFNNGYAQWSTWDNSNGAIYYDLDGMLTGSTEGVNFHSVKVSDTSWDAYKNWANHGSGTIGTIYKAIADQRTDLYNRGYWIDNLGNQRSIAYAGRAADSQIGLRSGYVATTAKYVKYAERAGMVGNVISAGEITYGAYEDGWTFGKNAQVATAGAVGGIVGAAEGALIGAYIGSFIPIPGAGTILGFVVGAGVGYIYSEIAKQTVENMYK